MSANARPEEDGDYHPEAAMDVDEGGSPRKGKGKTRAAVLEEREGAARCAGCAGRKSRCWVDPARIQKWKEAVARGVPPGRTPAGVACKECSGRKQKCFLPELSKERAALKPASKRKREEGEQAGDDREDERRASGSGAKAGGASERGDEAPKKKQRVEVVIPPRPREKGAPRAAQDRDSGPDIVTALVAINNSVASLARAVDESNDYLWVISEYVERLEWDRMPEISSDEESEWWHSGDQEVVRELDRNIVPRRDEK